MDGGPAEARWSTRQRGRELGASRRREEERKVRGGADRWDRLGREREARARRASGWRTALTRGPDGAARGSGRTLAGGPVRGDAG